MRFLLFALLIVAMAGSAAAMDLQTKGHGPTYVLGARTGYYCPGNSADSGFYQQKDEYYGNAFDVGAGGPLSYLDFLHYGWGFSGPYSYNVRVYDSATCTQLCMFGPLSAADAASAPAEEVVDVCSYNCNVTGLVIVAIEPLTCITGPGGSSPWDCYPDLSFDDDVDSPPPPAVAGCGSVVDNRVPPAQCFQIQGTDIGVVDFLFGIFVDECPPPTATQPVTWGQVKGLYR